MPGVFVLAINLTFETPADAQTFIDAWAPLAKYCKEHEPNTLTYEASIDDASGTEVLIYERYVAKTDLTVHQKSAPFLAFREHEAQKLVKTKSGKSFYETNVGYAGR